LAVGDLTETEAQLQASACFVGFRTDDRVRTTVEKVETRGFMKILVDAESQLILGAAILERRDEAIPRDSDIMYPKRLCDPCSARAHPPDGVGVEFEMLGELSSPTRR